MKQILGVDQGMVMFAPGGSGVGTITISALRGFDPSRLMAVTNITRKTLLYAAEASGKGGTWSATDREGGVLTLQIDTTGHDQNDILRCIYESPDTTPDDPVITIEDICREDGFTETSSVTRYSGENYATRTYTGVGTSLVQGQGQSFFAKYIHMSASRPCEVQLSMGTFPQANRGNSWDYRAYLSEGITMIPNQIMGNGASVSLYLENGDSAPIVFKAAFSGYRFTSDYNWKARRTILWIGDSIANASGNSGQAAWDPNTNYTFGVRNWLNDRGFDYRLVQKTNGGQRTVDAEIWRQVGMLGLAFPRKTGLIFYNMGANDYADPALAQTNVEIFVPWALKRHPNATVVLCGPTPAEDNTVHAGCETIRSSYSAYVTAQSNARLKYVNLGTAFDRTDSAFYATADTPGGRIHPNELGQSAIYDVLEPFMESIEGEIP